MKKRIALILTSIVAAATLALAGATFAFGGASGLILDDGANVQPGSLDDGKGLRSQTSITLGQAVARAQNAASGRLGQVDLEHFGGGVVYMVDVGDQEVRVDAADGRVVDIRPAD